MVSQRAGVSLYATLAVILVVAFLAAGVTGLFTANLNLTQAVANGQTAQAEAEAALNQAIYGLTDDLAATPTVRGTATRGVVDAYHVVDFDPSSSFPYSTNNQSDTATTGFGGRTVPAGHVHLVSTGFCRGQYRTLEVLLDLPPFPYAVALSGVLDCRRGHRAL